MRLQKQPKARSSASAEPAPKETLEVRVGTNQIANYFAAKDIFARGDGCISGHATNVKRWRSARGDQAPADQMPPKPAEKKEEEEKSYTGGTHRSSEQSTGTTKTAVAPRVVARRPRRLGSPFHEPIPSLSVKLRCSCRANVSPHFCRCGFMGKPVPLR